VAQYLLGRLRFENKRYAEALGWLNKSAAQGLAAAQYWLGLMYSVGEGVPKMMLWLFSGSRKPLTRGMLKHNFCRIELRRGNRRRKNIDEALKWFQKAADQGEAGARKK